MTASVTTAAHVTEQVTISGKRRGKRVEGGEGSRRWEESKERGNKERE